jgi:PAS domain S-box-containing protein
MGATPASPPPPPGAGSLPRNLSVPETWALGFSVLLFWVVVAPELQQELGTGALLAWIPATVVGILITFQIRSLALARTGAAGGSPVYVAELWSDHPLVARWAGWAYFHSWAIVPPVLAWILADLAAENLAAAGVEVLPLAIQAVILVSVYGLAFTGIRALSVVHLAFLVPSLGLLAVFGAQGLAQVMAPGAPAGAGALGPGAWELPGWTPWLATYFLVAYTTYGIETAAVFTADSRNPRRTLQALPVAAALSLPIMVGGSWLLHRKGEMAAGAAGSGTGVDSLLEIVATPFWGALAPTLVTFMVASCCLLACASSVAITPRVGWQLARDGVFPPILGRLNGAGVPRVALAGAAVLALLHFGLAPGEMILVGGATWVGFWALMHLGLWRRRGRKEVRWPHLALALGCLELVVLGVGGIVAGGWYVAGGLLVPAALVALDPLARRLPGHWTTPPFRPLPPGRRPGREAIEIILLLGLVVLTLVTGWTVARQTGDASPDVVNRIFIITLVIVTFLGVAWGGWTTLRRLAQVEAARSRSDDILATASDAVLLVDSGGRILLLNPAGRSLLERGSEGLEGRPLRDLLPSLPADPGQWGGWSEHETTLGSRARILEVAARRRAGEGPEEYTVTLRDLTEREAAHRALEESEERLDLALGAARAGVWDLDLASGFARTSPQWNQLAGLPPETPGLSLTQWEALLHPGDRAETLRALDLHLSGLAPLYEAEFRMRAGGEEGTGSWQWVLARGRVVERASDGTPRRILGIASDLSERKALESQLVQARKMEAVGQLAGGIAHDFNNALTAILGTTEFLAEALEEADPETRRDVETIRSSAEHAAGITRQLLAFSRRQQLRPQVVDVQEVLARVERLLSAFLGEDILLSTEVVGGELLLCWSDPSQLEQALVNLAINARDAMPDGGTLTIQAAAGSLPAGTSPSGGSQGGTPERAGIAVPEGIGAPAAAADDAVVIAVTDTGVGMDAATRERVFEPFFTTKPPGAGTGLGMAMVYGYARQSGGDVDVESEAGAGTCIRLFLPRAAAGATRVGGQGSTMDPGSPGARGEGVGEGGAGSAAAVGFGGGGEPGRASPQGSPSRPDAAAPGTGNGNGPGTETILVAEDDPRVRGLVVRSLVAAGYTVLEGGDGVEALATVREYRGPLHLLVTDLVMPRMGGSELAERIRKAHPGLPVLFMSGYPSRPAALSRAGAAPPYLQKPFRPQRFLEEVRRILDQGEGRGSGMRPPPEPPGTPAP